jgi:hypothetical protein
MSAQLEAQSVKKTQVMAEVASHRSEVDTAIGLLSERAFALKNAWVAGDQGDIFPGRREWSAY